MSNANADATPLTLPVPLAIGEETLPHSTTTAALRDAVARFNTQRFNRALDELQTLNPQWLSADEVLLFVEQLRHKPAAEVAALGGHPLDLSAPALKLYAADGFGRHGLRGAWKLVAVAGGGWAMSPATDAEDIVADLSTALAAESKRKVELDHATGQRLGAAATAPNSAALSQAEGRAHDRLVWVQRAAQALLEQLRPLLPATGALHGFTVQRVDGEKARLDAALVGAPLGGGIGMPGGSGSPGGPGSIGPPPGFGH